MSTTVTLSNVCVCVYVYVKPLWYQMFTEIIICYTVNLCNQFNLNCYNTLLLFMSSLLYYVLQALAICRVMPIKQFKLN